MKWQSTWVVATICASIVLYANSGEIKGYIQTGAKILEAHDKSDKSSKASQIASRLNATLPGILDEYTRIDKVVADDSDTIGYYYTITSKNAEKIYNYRKNSIRQTLVQSLCETRYQSKSTDSLVKAYHYYSPNHKKLGSFEIDANRCFHDPTDQTWELLSKST